MLHKCVTTETRSNSKTKIWHLNNSTLLKAKKTMNIQQAKEIVISAINTALEGKVEITEDMQLIGGESLLDSMKLVEVCLALEDLADEHRFEFDWTSEAAMSKSRSMFRSVAALAEEFANQSKV
jgi:acyl carrier protein